MRKLQLRNRHPVTRFWLCTDKRGPFDCWQWKGIINHGGYGQITADYKQWRAHRFSYHLHFGEIPEGLHVLHRCDNPGCVNPTHLFLGTNQENVRDRELKGRHGPSPCGEEHVGSKLTAAAVLDIRSKRLSARAFAALYRVSERYVRDIQGGEGWRHLATEQRSPPIA